MIEWLCISLVGLNIFQLVFWSYQQHRLIDKVMSGNYYSYQQAQSINEQVPKKVTEVVDLEDLRGVKAIHPFM